MLFDLGDGGGRRREDGDEWDGIEWDRMNGIEWDRMG